MAINDFNIGFLGKLDGTRSKNQINQDIEALKKSLNSLEIKATLDPQQKNALTKQLNLLQVSLDDVSFSPKALNDLVSQVNNALKGIQIDIPNINTSNAGKSAIQAGQQIGKQIQNGINSVTKNANFEKSFSFTGDGGNALSEARKVFSGMNEGTITVKENLDKMGNLNSFFVNIKKANGEIESLKYSLQEMEGKTGKEFVYDGGVINDSGAIKQFQQMEKAVTDYQNKLENLKTKYANLDINFSGFENELNNFKTGKTDINGLSTAFNNLNNSITSTVNNLKSQTSSFDPVQQALNNMRDLPSMIQNLETKMSGLSDKTSVAGIDIKDLQTTYSTLLSEINANGGKIPTSDKWINSFKTLTSTVAGATKQLDTLARAEAKAGKSNLTQKISNLQRLSKVNTIGTWADNNSKAMKKYGDRINEIITRYKQLNVAMDKVEANKLEAEFRTIKNVSREAGEIGATAFDKLGKAWEKFGGWSIATGTMVKGIQEIKYGIKFIGELDDAMADVAYTTPMTVSGFEKLGNSAIDMGKELKTSATNVLEAVKIYSTANTTADEILAKSKASILLSNVSGMSGEETSQTIQTILNQFELDPTNESLIGIVDTLEYVASQLNYDFSKSMEEISSGISESGNVAKQAGLSLEEYATILGTTIERSGIAGNQAGNAYKTIFSRITGASKTEGTLDEDISKAEASLRSIGVQVRDSENEFRDLTDIMSELGSVWDSLSSTEKSNVGYNIAGIRQLNVLNSLMSGWKDYEKIIESVDNKTGTAEKNQEKYEKTLQGSLSGLEAQRQAIWSNLLNSDTLSSGIDLLSELLSLLDGISKAFVNISSIAGGGNALGGSLGAISGLIMSLKGNGAVRWDSKNGLATWLDPLKGKIPEITKEVSGLFEEINKGSLTIGKKTDFNKWFDKRGVTENRKELQKFLTTWDGSGDIATAYQSYMKQSASATTLFSRATKAAGTAIKSVGAAMASMAVMWAVGEAISLVVESIDYLTSANERFLEDQQKIVDSSNEAITSYESEINTLGTLKDKLEDAQGNKSKLASIQSELNDAIGITPNLLDTESNSYDVANQKLIDRIKLLDELREKELEQKTTAAQNIYNNNVVDNDWGSDKSIYDYFTTTKMSDIQNHQAFSLLETAGDANILPNGTVTVENYDTLTKYLRVLAQKNDKSMAEIMASFLQTNYSEDMFASLPNAGEIQAYFDNQFNIVKEIASDYINNLDTVLPNESLYNVLQGIVESNPDDADKAINSFKTFIGSLEDANLEDIYSDYIESLSDNSIDSNVLYNQLQNVINNLIAQFPEARTQLEAFGNSVVTTVNSIFDDKPIKMSLKDAFELSEYSDIKEKLLELAKSGELSPETLSSVAEYNSLLEKTSNNAKDAYFQIQNMLSATEKLSAASNGLNSIKNAFKDVEDNGFVLASTLSSLPDAIKGLDGYDVFASIVGDPTQGVDAISNAFNEITKQYLIQQHTFSGLVDASSSEIQSYIANLKAMGITNAEEIVNQIDAELKTENDLINKAEAEYNDYLNNKDEATLSYLESASSNNSQLIGALGSTYKTDYNNWIDLLQRKSEAYNSFVEKIGGAYNDALTIMDNLSNNGVNMSASNISDAYAAQEEYKKLQKEAQSFKDNFKISLSTVNTDFKSNFSPKTSSGSSSSSSSSSTEDTWKAEFDAQYKTLKHQLAMNEITESQYYKTLDGLNKKYFANRKEYLEEYRQYEEEVYKGELSLQDKAISAIEKLRGLRVNMIKDMKQDEIDAINKVIDAEKKKLDAINETIDARKKAIELLKDETDHEQELSEKNKTVSDIQNQIESLKFDNSASAQKKRRELEEQLAEEQKNLSDYIADYEYDKAIESLDKESDIAEERYDKKEKKLQDQIQLIEEYLDNESQLIKDAMVDLNGMNDSMFNQMKKWAKETSGDVYEIVNAWKEAYESLKIYNGLKNIGGTYNSLQSNASKNTATNISTNKVSTSGNSSSSSAKSSPTSSGTGVKATHTVKAGDTLWVLAGKYYGNNTKYTKIKNANPNVNPNNLKVGSKLLIPFKSGGYTGNSEGLAILHKKEQVLNAEQTESWQNLVKDVLPKVQDMIPAISKIPDLSKLINSHSTPNISIGDINIQGSTNLTKSDLNKFRNDIVDDVFTEMQKSRVKSGRI